jgi:tRNA G10  N-methylase Trm11
MNIFGFQLWREYKLSIAEIFAVFPEGKTVYFDTEILLLQNLEKTKILEKASHLWGIIKIIEIVDKKNLLETALHHEWKFKYGISIFWKKENLKKILIEQKKELKNNNISSRFINKDFKNLSSAQILWEKLDKSWTDYSYIINWDSKYFWKTIWIQNIEEYSKRDYSKDRDMQVWMLPPKLAQIMINLWGGRSLYDPFVWLWTVLIESILIWYKNIYGSDLSEKMVDISNKNIDKLLQESSIKWVKKKIFEQNSKYISEVDFLEMNHEITIVTEWYLWEVMTQKNISIERIEKQKKSLIELYKWFFSWLSERKFSGNIIISFPFWEIKGKCFYFNEIYEILAIYCSIEKLLPNHFETKTTKSGSLLYKREKQLVWREVFKLRMK